MRRRVRSRERKREGGRERKRESERPLTEMAGWMERDSGAVALGACVSLLASACQSVGIYVFVCVSFSTLSLL